VLHKIKLRVGYDRTNDENYSIAYWFRPGWVPCWRLSPEKRNRPRLRRFQLQTFYDRRQELAGHYPGYNHPERIRFEKTQQLNLQCSVSPCEYPCEYLKFNALWVPGTIVSQKHRRRISRLRYASCRHTWKILEEYFSNHPQYALSTGEEKHVISPSMTPIVSEWLNFFSG
jgi:hypothetical protein